jgi:hypothetical protein
MHMRRPKPQQKPPKAHVHLPCGGRGHICVKPSETISSEGQHDGDDIA